MDSKKSSSLPECYKRFVRIAEFGKQGIDQRDQLGPVIVG